METQVKELLSGKSRNHLEPGLRNDLVSIPSAPGPFQAHCRSVTETVNKTLLTKLQSCPGFCLAPFRPSQHFQHSGLGNKVSPCLHSPGWVSGYKLDSLTSLFSCPIPIFPWELQLPWTSCFAPWMNEAHSQFKVTGIPTVGLKGLFMARMQPPHNTSPVKSFQSPSVPCLTQHTSVLSCIRLHCNFPFTCPLHSTRDSSKVRMVPYDHHICLGV